MDVIDTAAYRTAIGFVAIYLNFVWIWHHSPFALRIKLAVGGGRIVLGTQRGVTSAFYLCILYSTPPIPHLPSRFLRVTGTRRYFVLKLDPKSRFTATPGYCNVLSNCRAWLSRNR